MWRTDSLGRTLKVSEVMLEIVGRTANHDLDHWTKCIHPDDRQRVVTTRSLSITRRLVYFVTYRVRRHGTNDYVSVVTVGRPDRSGGFVGFTRLADARATTRPRRPRVIPIAGTSRTSRCRKFA